jgi:polysaccharide pyruvyl transferase WcaK-like protein
MKILVLGWYGHQNIGDESYKISLPRLMPQHTFTFVDKIGTTEGYDAVVLGGGNVMSDYFLAQLRGLNVPVYGLSVGGDKDYPGNVPFVHVWGREHFTVNTMREHGVNSTLLPDLGLTLRGDRQAGCEDLQRRFKAEGCDMYERVITVVLNGHLVNGLPRSPASHALHFLDFAYRFSRVVDETMASFVFLSFGTSALSDDRVANSWVASKCKFWKKNLMLYERRTVQETLDIIAASDAVISSRLHSSVFAFSNGVPFVDITHHSKNGNFLELIGKGSDSVSFWEYDSDKMHNKIQHALTLPRHQEADAFRALIQKEIDAVRFAQP